MDHKPDMRIYLILDVLIISATWTTESAADKPVLPGPELLKATNSPDDSYQTHILTCADTNKFHLPENSSFIWIDVGGYDLSEVSYIKNYIPQDAQNNKIQIFIKNTHDDDTVNILCVDPLNHNYVNAFRIPIHRNGHINMYRAYRTTQCPLQEEVVTVLNCNDSFIPPTLLETCHWTRKAPDSDDSHSIPSKHDSYLVLESNASLGLYRCKCTASPHMGHAETTLTVSVFNVSAVAARTEMLNDYMLCIRMSKEEQESKLGKKDYEPMYEEKHNITDPEKIISSKSDEIDQLKEKNQHLEKKNQGLVAGVVVLSLLLLISFGAATIYWFRSIKDSRSPANRSEGDQQSDAEEMVNQNDHDQD